MAPHLPPTGGIAIIVAAFLFAMTITTTANAHKGSEVYSPVKLPETELHLLAQTENGETLGRLRLSRVEGTDETVFTLESVGRGRVIREWLEVDGLNKADITRKKKQSTKTYTRARADLQFLPRGLAVYFLNAANDQHYRDLNVLLEPSEE